MKETPEQAAQKYAKNVELNHTSHMLGFINGAKWQQERMYSEEEIHKIIELSCEEGMLIQRTINDKVKIPYSRIKDFKYKLIKQFNKK